MFICLGKISTIDRDDIKDNAEILFADTPVIIDIASESDKLKWAQSTWAGMLKFVIIKSCI